VDEAIARFLSYLEVRLGRTGNTVLAYRADLLQFHQAIAEGLGRGSAPDGLTPEAVAIYLNWLTSRGYRPATLSRKMAAVRAFLEYLREVEGVGGAVLADGLHPPPAPRHKPRLLAQDEIGRLLEAPAAVGTPRGLRDTAVLAILYATGMRAADAVGLQLSDVDLDRGQVWRPPHRQQPLPLGEAAAPLRRYLEQGRPHLVREAEVRAVFLNQRGQELSRQGLWLVVKKWAEAAGLGDDVSPHSLRHALAQHLLIQGKSRREVQQFLGLRSPNAIRSTAKDEPDGG
jgi:integrase/recombinase XerD